MNKTLKYILFTAIALSASSCGGYLSSDSADLLIPSSLDDYSPLLLGTSYPSNFSSQISFVNLMTDDVEMGPLYYDPIMKADRYVKNTATWAEGIDGASGYGQYAYTWTTDYENYTADTFWDGRYSNILGCNTIIDALPTMTYTSSQTAQYKKLAMQAYTLRAYNYFCLVNTYAKPYSEANLSEPGVVIKTSPNIETSQHPRATIKETYDQINSDITAAESYVDGASTQASKFEMTAAGLYFLATRVALFQQNWDGVIESANKFFKYNKAILDLNKINASTFGLPTAFCDSAFNVNDIRLDEVVFGFGRSDGDLSYLAPKYTALVFAEFGFHPSWTGESSLMGLYQSDDLRLQAYYMRRYYKDPTSTRRMPVYVAGQYYPFKYEGYRTRSYYSSEAWRTPEVYLNLAEAYAQKASGVSAEAVQILNQLREKKFVTGSTQADKKVSDFASKDDLIKFIWQERRRELSFQEIMRFWDMRREGMPAQTHKLYKTVSTYDIYNLPQGTDYTLPIPTSETDYNKIPNNDYVNIASSGSGND
jgi:hypothetical protein